MVNVAGAHYARLVVPYSPAEVLMRHLFRDFVLSFLILAAMMGTGMAQAGREVQAEPPAGWDRLVDQYFDDYYFPFHPTAGTSAGFHRYDTQLEDYSHAGVEAEIKALKQARGKIEGFSANRLTAEQQADRELVLHEIDGRLLELEQIRQWERNPDRYAGGITYSVFLIMSRNFAPPEERLRSVIARERLMPKVFEAARANLANPPKIYTQVALMQLPGIIHFFQQDVPAAFKEVQDRKLLAEFNQSNQAVIESLGAYQKWLKDDLLPRSNGDFRIGAENYRKKLLYDEMVDTPLDELLKLGYADLHRNQQWLKETAARIDPSKTLEQVLAEAQNNYPPPDKLPQTVRDMFGDLRGFIERAHIVTIPSPVLPIVEETPPFMRALTFASMDTPGPYEHTAKEAFFNVTVPEKDWTPEHVREFMAQFNYDTLTSVATHEAYPGHYVQFLWVQNAPSKVRKLVGSHSNAEGWAHYCEQMMLDEGYGRPTGAASADRNALEILSDTQGVDFGSYLSKVLPIIRQNWYGLIPNVATRPQMKQGTTSVEFTILKNGKVSSPKVLETSGDIHLHRAALAAVSASSPLPPLPEQFRGESLALRFHFVYNPSKETDEKSLKLRLGQLQDALLRNVRYIVGIEMHTGKMTFEQAVDFFVKEGYQSRAVAETETKRGTSDPTYLVYTLGKLEILKLREDYQQKMGAKFNLQEFHDQFLKQGFPPVKIIRKAMMGDDSPVL